MNSDLLSSESKKIIHKALSFAQQNSNPELKAAHILKSIVQSTNNLKSLMLNQLHGNKDSLIIALDAIIDTYPIDFNHETKLLFLLHLSVFLWVRWKKLWEILSTL